MFWMDAPEHTGSIESNDISLMADWNRFLALYTFCTGWLKLGVRKGCWRKSARPGQKNADCADFTQIPAAQTNEATKISENRRASASSAFCCLAGWRVPSNASLVLPSNSPGNWAGLINTNLSAVKTAPTSAKSPLRPYSGQAFGDRELPRTGRSCGWLPRLSRSIPAGGQSPEER